MSGGMTVSFVDFAPPLSAFESACCVSFSSFLVRNWCGCLKTRSLSFRYFRSEPKHPTSGLQLARDGWMISVPPGCEGTDDGTGLVWHHRGPEGHSRRYNVRDRSARYQESKRRSCPACTLALATRGSSASRQACAGSEAKQIAASRAVQVFVGVSICSSADRSDPRVYAAAPNLEMSSKACIVVADIPLLLIAIREGLNMVLQRLGRLPLFEVEFDFRNDDERHHPIFRAV